MKPIMIKPQNRGKLHRELHVPEKEPISEAKLEAAKKGAEPAEKKRIQFAENAKHWNKGKQPAARKPYSFA